VLLLLDDERDVLPRAVTAFVTGPFTDDLVSCPTSRRHINFQGYDTLLSRPRIDYDAEMKSLPEKELLECHWKDMNPFFRGIGTEEWPGRMQGLYRTFRVGFRRSGSAKKCFWGVAVAKGISPAASRFGLLP